MADSSGLFQGFLQNQLVYLYHPGSGKWVYGNVDAQVGSVPAYAVYDSSVSHPHQRSVFVMLDSENPKPAMNSQIDFSQSDFNLYDITLGFSKIGYSAVVGCSAISGIQTYGLGLSTMYENSNEPSPIVVRKEGGDPFASTDNVCPETILAFYLQGSSGDEVLVGILDGDILSLNGVYYPTAFQAIPLTTPPNDAPSGRKLLFQCLEGSGNTASCQSLENGEDPTGWNPICSINSKTTYTGDGCGGKCSNPPGYECVSHRCDLTKTFPAPYASRDDCLKACGTAPGPSPKSKFNLTIVDILGIAVGIVIFVALIFALVFYFSSKSKKNRSATAT
jgi:hypothetical protein